MKIQLWEEHRHCKMCTKCYLFKEIGEKDN